VDLTADLNTIAVYAAFGAPIVLIVVYTIAAPWYRSAVGRALVQVKAGIVLAMVPPVMHRLTGSADSPLSPTFVWIQTGAWLFLAAMVLRLAWLSWRINKNARKAARAPSRPAHAVTALRVAWSNWRIRLSRPRDGES
jgi:hypothetical protein